MNETEPEPAEEPAEFTREEFDSVHEAEARGQVSARLSAEAFGQEYPSDVHPFSSTTKWLLGRLVSETKLGPRDRQWRTCLGWHRRSRGFNPAKEGALHE